MEGTVFGRYRLAKLLGRGGMGEVWRAYDTVTKRDVAIKLLRQNLSQEPTFVHRFRREARVVAQLNHPNILPIHDYGEIDGQLFVDMRIVEGTDLASVLADGPLDPTRAVSIVEQVAKALQAAHKAELVHRDVKPSNILLDRDDFAYLIDFGIARAASHTDLTVKGSAIGTYAYMAPERLTSNELDARSDVYSLACVLYECLTGTGPYANKSFEQVIAGHIHAPPPRPSAAREGLSPRLDDVLAIGLAKQVDRRYQTAVDLARAAREAVDIPRQVMIRPPALPTDTLQPPPDVSRTVPARIPPPAAKTVVARKVTDFPVGASARVVTGDKRFRDRVGRIVSSEAPYVELKFKGSVGTYSFERNCVRIESRPQEPVPSPPTPVGAADRRDDPRWAPAQPESNPIDLHEGGFAKVVVGDKRFKGRIGRVTSIAPPHVELKFKGSVGSYSFRRSCVTPDAGSSW